MLFLTSQFQSIFYDSCWEKTTGCFWFMFCRCTERLLLNTLGGLFYCVWSWTPNWYEGDLLLGVAWCFCLVFFPPRTKKLVCCIIALSIVSLFFQGTNPMLMRVGRFFWMFVSDWLVVIPPISVVYLCFAKSDTTQHLWTTLPFHQDPLKKIKHVIVGLNSLCQGAFLMLQHCFWNPIKYYL